MIKRIENKDDYIDLLLEADPSKEMISKYLNDSDVYGLKVDEEIVSLAVILPISRNTLELKNLVTKEEHRNKGYSKTSGSASDEEISASRQYKLLSALYERRIL